MDTFTATKGSVVGPYGDSVSIDAFGPEAVSESAIDAAGDIAGSVVDETGGHVVLMRGGSTTVFDAAPGALYTSVTGIDAAGDVIGDYAFLVNDIIVDHTYIYRDGTATTVGPSTWTSSEPTVVNAAGTFAGSYTDAAGSHGFVDDAGVISSFDAPTGDLAPGVDAIDAKGDVAGTFESSDYKLQIFLDQNGTISAVSIPISSSQARVIGLIPSGTVIGYYDIDGQFDYFSANPASPTDAGLKSIAVPNGGTLVDALGFDPQGDIVGTYSDPTTAGDRIFRTDALGVSTPVEDPPGATSTFLTSISSDRTLFGSYQDATGSHLFTDRAGVITTVPAVPNSMNPYATGEDAAGDVIGEYSKVYPNAVDPTFLYKDGASAPLTVPGRPLGARLVVVDGAGDVVGTIQDADGIHMFVDKGGTIATEDAAPGAYSTTPVYMDNAGDIIGHYTASDGIEHLFVDKNGTFTTVNVPSPNSRSTAVPTIEVAGANGDFAGDAPYVAIDGNLVSQFFAYIGGTLTTFTIPSSVGYFPRLVGVDPQGDIGISAESGSGGSESALRLPDGSFQSIVVPGSVADTTDLTRIDRAGNLIGSYAAPSGSGGAPVSLGFVKLASSGAYVTVTPPGGAYEFRVTAVDAAGDTLGEAFNPDGTSDIFEQAAAASQASVVPLGSGTGRETMVGTDSAGDIAANATAADTTSEAFLVIGGQINAIEGSSSATSTTIQSIDAAGDILGTYTDASGTHNFVTFASSAPRISNTHASSTSGEAPVPPFTEVTVQDLRDGATDTLTIALSGGGGTLADGAGYGGASTLKQTGPGTYTLTGAATGITAELDALSFTPTAGAPGTPNPTTFTLTDASSVGGSATETVTDSATVVTDTAVGAPSTGAGTTGTDGAGAGTTSTGGSSPAPSPVTTTPTPAPVSVAPTPVTPTLIPVAPGSGGVVGVTPADAVAFNDQVYCDRGVLVVSGTASSAAGVSRVEITATLENGKVRDLGSATVDADGNFSFRDRVGAHTQGFITATETDKAGVRTSALADYSLTGGLGGTYTSEQDRYNADGSVVTATDLYKTSGAQDATLNTGGLAFFSDTEDVFEDNGQPSSTFLFDPGYGHDVVDLFRPDNTDHDTLSFKGSDFGNTPAGQLASLLAHSQNRAAGDVVITDPTSKDKVVLTGVSRDALIQNERDITFHA